MNLRKITVGLAALALGAGTAGACGSSGGDREDVNQSNEGEQNPQGGKVEVETGPTTLGSTGPDQPEVTQPETGP